ncbi:golgin subfamily A member 1-like isoform X5 [Amphibalanus amphitrite]|uniref:golgin subfamily A member 1-like isoform X5 n=1 Tax=Amphibalanus amphitrite TaxID=1232801 RepID=UPI001C8FB32C|nr:golgin subfamily A member 1-like isoform X5 [Amphibalanus amphitrite]
MGCGQSAEAAAAYSNRGSIATLKPLPQQHDVGNSGSGSDGPEPANGTEPVVDKATLEEYLQVEKELGEARRADPQVLSQLEMKKEALQKMTQKVEQLERHYADLEALARDGDQTDTKEAVGALQSGQRVSTAEEERVAGFNNKEIAKQERDEAIRQKENIQREVEQLQNKASRLQNLLTKQDALLGKIFGGEYGSELENKLEQELDALEAHKARIMEANYKWRQAQMMMEFACRQLAVAVQKWQDLPEVPQTSLEVRYTMAAEARNNLVAASQNIEGAHRTLSHVEFPYCNPDEVETLNKATSYVFTDMQSEERHAHAGQCYDITHKRAAALLQWFDQVLNTTIMEDLAKVNLMVKETSQKLRQERVRLIKLKAQEVWGADVDIEIDSGVSADDEDLNAMLMEGVSDSEVAKTDETGDSPRAKTPPPLTAEEMAPLPTSEAIFGKSYEQLQEDLEQMRTELESDMNYFQQEQDRQAERARGDLQAKLNARRRNRAMRSLEEKQRQELAEGAVLS